MFLLVPIKLFCHCHATENCQRRDSIKPNNQQRNHTKANTPYTGKIFEVCMYHPKKLFKIRGQTHARYTNNGFRKKGRQECRIEPHLRTDQINFPKRTQQREHE